MNIIAKQLLYLYPIMPHICEYLYEKVFNKNQFDVVIHLASQIDFAVKNQESL